MNENIITYLACICFIFLIGEILVYFCKESIKICNESIRLSKNKIKKTVSYSYVDKIAK